MGMNVWDVYPERSLGSSLGLRRKEILQSRGDKVVAATSDPVWIHRAGMAPCHCPHSVEGTKHLVLMADKPSPGRGRGHDIVGGAASSKAIY